MSEDDFRGLLATLEIERGPGLAEKIVEGLATPLSECLSERGGFLNGTVHYARRAAKDAARIKASHLYSKVDETVHAVKIVSMWSR
jgi:vacuolar-type H+-ATPase catalytic subunit A/Vma1